MKKKIIAALFLLSFSINAAAQIYSPIDYPNSETIEDINFLNGNPLFAEKGEFTVIEEEPPIVANYSFDDENTEKLSAANGIFEIKDGKYIQQSTESIVSKAMINEEISNFTLEFDATALSNASTVLIFLGENSDGYYTFEYSYSGAVLRKNGTENIATAQCSLLENQTVHFSVKLSDGMLEIQTDGKEFMKTDKNLIPPGKSGIGTWASSVAFDNLIMKKLSSNGFDKKLFLPSKSEALAYSDKEEENVRVSANLSAKDFLTSSVGIILRDDYLFSVDGKYAYISELSASGNKILSSVPHRMQSGVFFLLEARSEGERLTLSINNSDVLSTYVSKTKSGKYGIYKNGTEVYINNIKAERLNNSSFTHEITNDEHTAAYEILSLLEIGSFSENPLKSVTRLDFAEYISKLLLLTTPEKADFSDTDSPYAAAVVENGYMNCISENTFGADIPIKTIDAAKVLVDICGYKNLALKYGAYPSGYSSVAAQLNLTDSIKSENLNSADAAVLIFRALFTERYKEATISSSGKSIAEEMYSFSSISGVCHSCSTDNMLNSSVIKIGNIQLLCDNYNEIEGRYVKAYYKEEKGENTLLYAYKTKSEETVISAEDIEGSDSLNNLKYSVGGKLYTTKLSDNAKIIYNGEYIGTVSEKPVTSYETENGELTIIKNQNGEDFVFINEYKILLVERTVLSGDSVYDILSESLVSLKDTDLYDESGKITSLSSINEYDTIKFYPSKNKNSKAYISFSKSVQGKIIEINEDKILIGGDEYDYYSNIGNIKDLKVGSEAIFYFDENHKAVYAVYTGSEDYAYLAKSVYNSDNESARLWLYSLSDGAIKCDSTEKVVFYDYNTSYSSKKITPKQLFNALNGYNGLIQYKTDNNGKISSVSLPRIADKREDPTNDGYFTRNFSKENCQQIFNTFYTRFVVTPTTKIVQVPSDKENLNGYSMKTYGTLMDDELYSVDIYDCNEKYEIGVATVYKEPTYYNKRVGVVKEIISAKDKSGETVLGIVMYTSGGFKTVYSKENILCDNDNAYSFGTLNLHVSDLKCGDVISFHTDSNGYLKDFITAFQNKENQDYYRTSIQGWWSENVPHQALAIGYAKVEKVYSDRFFIKMFYGTVNCISKVSTAYSICDKKAKESLTKASLNDLQEGDSILCVWNNSVLNDVIIYR